MLMCARRGRGFAPPAWPALPCTVRGGDFISKPEWMLVVDGSPLPDLFRLKEAQYTASVLTAQGHEVHAVNCSRSPGALDVARLQKALLDRGISADLIVR